MAELQSKGDRQSTQQDLVRAAKAQPGVAAVLDVYGKLSPYTSLFVNVQTSQVRSATGGNA